jgi:hypothetical protein
MEITSFVLGMLTIAAIIILIATVVCMVKINKQEKQTELLKQLCAGIESDLRREIENSYNNGAEWCNYGWSEGQMAYFPTQKSTWNELQKDDRLKNICGRPGVNGGYMLNPNIKFGANCFGVKPRNDKWVKQAMPQFPKLQPSCSKKEQDMNERAKSLRNSAQINPISRDKWSRF